MTNSKCYICGHDFPDGSLEKIEIAEDSLTVCKSCCTSIKQFADAIKETIFSANSMSYTLTIIEGMKNGYETYEEERVGKIDELRETVRDTRPGGREH